MATSKANVMSIDRKRHDKRVADAAKHYTALRYEDAELHRAILECYRDYDDKELLAEKESEHGSTGRTTTLAAEINVQLIKRGEKEISRSTVSDYCAVARIAESQDARRLGETTIKTASKAAPLLVSDIPDNAPDAQSRIMHRVEEAAMVADIFGRDKVTREDARIVRKFEKEKALGKTKLRSIRNYAQEAKDLAKVDRVLEGLHMVVTVSKEVKAGKLAMIMTRDGKRDRFDELWSAVYEFLMEVESDK